MSLEYAEGRMSYDDFKRAIPRSDDAPDEDQGLAGRCLFTGAVAMSPPWNRFDNHPLRNHASATVQ
jgi:hypothetical protein